MLALVVVFSWAVNSRKLERMRIGRRRAGGTTKQSNNWRNSRELERMKIVCRMAGGRTKQTTTSCKIKFSCQSTWSRTRLGGYDEICQFDEILQVLHSGGQMVKPPFFLKLPIAFMLVSEDSQHGLTN